MGSFAGRLSVLIALGNCLWLAPSAMAGGFVIKSISGGTASIEGPNGQSWSVPYAQLGNGIYGYDGVSRNANGGTVGTGSIDLSGALNVVLVWDPVGVNDPAPPKAIVHEYVGTFAQGSQFSCQTSIGGTRTNQETSTGEEIHRYRVLIVDDDGKITLTINPAANASLPNPWNGLSHASAKVLYSIDAQPLRIDLQGTVKEGTTEYVMVGQFVTAFGYAGTYSISDHNWVATQTFLKGIDWGPFGVGTLGGYYEWKHNEYHNLVSQSQPTFRGFWDVQSAKHSITLAGNILLDGEIVTQFVVDKGVVVEGPAYEFNYSVASSNSYILNGSEVTGVSSMSEPHTPPIFIQDPGILFTGQTHRPARYSNQLGARYAPVQRVILRHDHWLYPNPIPGHQDSSPFKLDTSFPYMPDMFVDDRYGAGYLEQAWEEPDAPFLASDSPYVEFVIPSIAVSFDIDSQFEMCMMYSPPGNPPNVEWVPLHVVDWVWVLDNVSRGTPIQNWPSLFWFQQGVSVSTQFQYPGSSRVSWDEVFFANN